MACGARPSDQLSFMDQGYFPNADSSVHLLNEIDILLAQARLMELYLKQAQATAADDSARLKQQHYAELAALRAALAEKEQLARKQADVIAQGQNLTDQVREVAVQLDEKQRLLDQRDRDLDSARAEVTGLQEQLAEVESSCQRAEASAASELEQARTAFAAQTAGLQSALAAAEEAAQNSQAAKSQIEATLNDEIASLRNELEEKQRQIESRESDRLQAESEIDRLRRSVAELETANLQNAAKETEFADMRRDNENRIAELEHVIIDKDRELTEREEAASAVELSLQGRLHELQGELSRNGSALTDQQNELQEARATIAALSEQVRSLDAARAEAVASNMRILQENRQQVDDELNHLRAVVAQKDAALQGAASARQSLEQGLGVEMAELRERNRALEQARHEAEENWLRSGFIQAELQARLKAKTDEVEQARISAGEVREQLDTRINDLQLEIAQTQLLAESRSAAMSDLKDRLEQLAKELAQAKSEQTQSMRLLEEDGQSRLAQENEIAQVHETYQKQLQDLRSELAREQEKFHNTNIQNQELTHCMAELEKNLSERNESLAAANSAVAALKAQLDDRAREQERHLADARALVAIETELTGLRQEYQQMTSALAQQEECGANQRGQVQALEDLLRDQNELNSRQARDLATTQAEAATLRQRITELETTLEQGQRVAASHAEQIKQDYDARLATLSAALTAKSAELEDNRVGWADLEQSLRHELQEQSWALAQQQAAAEQMAAAHRAEMQKFEAKLNDQQSLSHLADGELEKATTQASVLQRRVEELEVELRHAELTAVGRAEQTRQDTTAQVEQLNSALRQKSRELEDRSIAQSTLEQSLRQELDRLMHEIEERNQLLQNRNDELARVRADLDGTRDRLYQSEASSSLAEHARSDQVEHMRAESQAQLASLQAELSQREWALQEHQMRADGVEQKYRDEIETLRRQLTERPPPDDQSPREADLSLAPFEMTPRPAETRDAARADTAYFAPQSHDRRWRNGFASKRRWKL